MKTRYGYIGILSLLLMAFSFTNANAAYRLEKTQQPYKPNFITNSVEGTSLEASHDDEASSYGKGGHSHSGGHSHAHSSGHHSHVGAHGHHSFSHGHHYSSHYHHYYHHYSHTARIHNPQDTDYASTSIFFDILGLIPIYVFSVIGIICGFIGMIQGRRPRLARAGVIIGVAEVVILTVVLLFMGIL